MPAEPIPPAQPARTMAHTFAACSRNDDGSRLRAATHRRPSGRGRPQRTDPSTITSPASRPRTQISPGVRGRIGQKNRRPARNHSPPGPVDREALLQISPHVAPKARRTSRGFDLEDLVLHRATGRGHLDRLALLVADDRLANRRLVGEFVLRRVRLGRADDVVLDRLLGRDVAQLDLRADRDDVLGDVLLVDHLRISEPFLEQRDPVLEQRLLVLGVVIFGVLGNVAEFARDPNPVRDLAPFVVGEVRDLFLELLVSLWSKDDFLHNLPFPKEKRGAIAPSRARIVAIQSGSRNSSDIYDLRSMQVNLHETWHIVPVEIPSRLVLAPMEGVSVQAFRRQGRRFGAGLVCPEMVSCAGLQHGNERTLAVPIFGSDPGVMADGPAMVEEAGAEIVDINLGCPVKKVTKTGAGATLLDEPDRACRVVQAVASAVSVPVTVKLRRGLENGSRACLSVGPRLVEAGAASLTLHPRSAKQMYTGAADHALTAELVSLVDVPVVASGDITSRARAQAVLAATGAAAVMVGRAAQGNPWALQEILEGDGVEP